MTDTAPQATNEFEFSSENLQAGDLLHLTHQDSEVAIAIVNDYGVGGFWGMGASSDGSWCGPYGPIDFQRPIRIGEVTDATFNNTTRLEVAPLRLELHRNGVFTYLLL